MPGETALTAPPGRIGPPDATRLHVWHVDLCDPRWDAWQSVLDGAEVQRLQRVVHAPSRDDARRSRIALRLLLSRYLGCAAHALGFTLGAHGKPGLQRPAWPGFFNLSHSHGRALVAVASDEVGVDIEHCAERQDVDRLLAMICSTQETGTLPPDMPPQARQQLLYQLWTRKEAYCKAIGLGLGKAPDAFSVIAPHDGGTAPAVAEVQDAGEPGRWWVHALPCAPGWTAALCTRQPSASIVQRTWTPESARCRWHPWPAGG